VSLVRRAVPLAVILILVSAQAGFAASLALTSAHLTAVTKTYGAQVTCTLAAAADSYVDKFSATTNFGTNTLLNVSPNSLTTERAFIRFDLTSCSPAIPIDALVRSASLRLTVATLTTATRTVELRTAMSAWTETVVTWNNQPVASATVSASLSVALATAAGTVLTWSASADVQAFVSGAATNVGWRLGDSAEGVALGPVLSLDAREAATGQPQLVVVYVP
jgi:hypothetical protein